MKEDLELSLKVGGRKVRVIVEDLKVPQHVSLTNCTLYGDRALEKTLGLENKAEGDIEDIPDFDDDDPPEDDFDEEHEKALAEEMALGDVQPDEDELQDLTEGLMKGLGQVEQLRYAVERIEALLPQLDTLSADRIRRIIQEARGPRIEIQPAPTTENIHWDEPTPVKPQEPPTDSGIVPLPLVVRKIKEHFGDLKAHCDAPECPYAQGVPIQILKEECFLITDHGSAVRYRCGCGQISPLLRSVNQEVHRKFSKEMLRLTLSHFKETHGFRKTLCDNPECVHHQEALFIEDIPVEAFKVHDGQIKKFECPVCQRISPIFKGD